MCTTVPVEHQNRIYIALHYQLQDIISYAKNCLIGNCIENSFHWLIDWLITGHNSWHECFSTKYFDNAGKRYSGQTGTATYGTCSLVVMPLDTRLIWKKVNPPTGSKSNPITIIRPILKYSHNPPRVGSFNRRRDAGLMLVGKVFGRMTDTYATRPLVLTRPVSATTSTYSRQSPTTTTICAVRVVRNIKK